MTDAERERERRAVLRIAAETSLDPRTVRRAVFDGERPRSKLAAAAILGAVRRLHIDVAIPWDDGAP